MNKEMIISASAHEKRVAILENGVVMEFYVERIDETQAVVGNVYKGRVVKVLPGMQSAFVDIGLERDAFLYVSDFFEEEGNDEYDTESVSTEGQSRGKGRDGRDSQRQQSDRDLSGRHKRERDGRSPLPEPAESTAKAKPVIEDQIEFDSRLLPPDLDVDDSLSEVSMITDALDLSVSPEAIVVELDPEELQTVLDAESEVQLERVELEPEEEEPVVAEPVATEEPDLDLALALSDGFQFERVTDHDVPHVEPEPPAPESEVMVDAPEISPESVSVAEIQPVAVEAEAKPQGRRRGRKKAEPAKVEPPPVEVPVQVEPAPVEPTGKKKQTRGRKKAVPAPALEFERILDDDVLSEAGDLLKEAIVQHKILEQTRQAEYETAPVLAGDEEATPTAVEAASPATEVVRPAPVRVADEEPATEEVVSDADLTDSEASIGKRSRNSEFASRRGRRGRRRGRPATGGGPGQADEETGEPVLSDSDVAVLLGDEAESDGADSETPDLKLKDDSLGDDSAVPPQPPVAVPPPARREPRDLPPPRDTRGKSDARPPREFRGRAPGITDLLREGQEILVQIAKEPIGTKGARITSYVALPGRYLVYMPTVAHIGVSRKIPSDQERTRLKRTMINLRDRDQIPGGFIVRTACEGHTEEELREDMMYLFRTWQDMRKRSEHSKPGTVVYRELDLVQRLLRDHLSNEFSVIRVDNEEEYARVVDFISRFQPKLLDRVKLYTRKRQIFEEYGVQTELDAALKPRVWLKSGGFIVINQTEALVAIDVNTGKFVGRSNRLEDTIVKTNLEAAVEIVRQIRLRDLGGIIVLDFIDMEERKNRQKVMQVLEQEIKSDRSPSKILQFNDFGLVAITRKRVRQSLERILCEPCPYCTGAGMVKSAETVCYEILGEARRMASDMEGETRSREVTLRINPSVAKALRNEQKQVWGEIEDYLGCSVSLQSDPNIHQEHYDFAFL
ncbi:MAG TPA: Rne/Rng family ribonuclease [Acidobacteriota bacterium]|nr:Rne/Rng family ribonuclease [Acidobacteriota bacterium]